MSTFKVGNASFRLSAALLDIGKRPLRFEKVANPILTKTLQFSSSVTGTKKDQIPFYGRPAPPSTSEASSLNLLQRVTVALHSATTALADPERGDAVAALGDVTGHMALMNLHDIMKKDDTGRLILQERPLIHNAAFDFDELEKKPGTFGHAYATFMKGHGFDPDGRSQVRFVQDPDLAYIMLRYRQCHDFWHVLTGLPPTVVGELGIKWLELFQTGLPVAALSATVGSLRLSAEERDLLNQHYLPWAIRVGKHNSKCSNLMNVYYEKEFDTNLLELRNRLGIEPAPQIK